MENNYLGLLGLAKKANMLEIGDEACRAAISEGKVRLVLVAGDASERTCESFRLFAESANVPNISVSESRADLGNALGRRPCAVVAVCDIGFAAAIAKKLSESNEDARLYLDEIEKKAKKISARKNKGKRRK